MKWVVTWRLTKWWGWGQRWRSGQGMGKAVRGRWELEEQIACNGGTGSRPIVFLENQIALTNMLQPWPSSRWFGFMCNAYASPFNTIWQKNTVHPLTNFSYGRIYDNISEKKNVWWEHQMQFLSKTTTFLKLVILVHGQYTCFIPNISYMFVKANENITIWKWFSWQIYQYHFFFMSNPNILLINYVVLSFDGTHIYNKIIIIRRHLFKNEASIYRMSQ